MPSSSDPPPPPPVRKAPRRLSLKMAIAALTRREYKNMKPLLSPGDEFPKINSQSGNEEDIEAQLLDLQAHIINREELLAEKEKYLEARTRDLNEKEALLEAHQRLIEAKASGSSPDNPGHRKELEAMKALQAELIQQEASLKEARQHLKKREAYIEECENELLKKSMQLSEREAHVEQGEENLAAAERRRPK